MVTLGLMLGWKGVDWPAQVYRVELFRSQGWVGVDTGWYGGNIPLAYSALFPPLAAALSIGALAVGSAGVAAWAFDRLVAFHAGRGRRLGSLLFAAGMVVPVAVGQLPYLLAVAFGLVAALSMRRWPWVAVAAGAACGLTSPLAGLFLALVAVAAAVTGTGHRWRPLLVAFAAMAPVVATTAMYHQGGLFPFRTPILLLLLVACGIALLVLPRQDRALRVGTLLYAAVAVAAFAVPSPLGENVTRLGATVGVPMAAAVLIPLRRWLGAALLVPLLLWQWSPAVGAITSSGADPSSHADFYAPLLAELRTLNAVPGRLEIPLTFARWETAWVAPTISLARGWERQLDVVDNSIFYEEKRLTAATYQRWLDATGITWVALPNVPLDYSALAEARLLQQGLGYLHPMWQGAHWTLWRVDSSPGLVTGPGRLVSLSADRFTVASDGPADLTVRVRYSPLWTVDGSGACVSSAPDGWTHVRVGQPGPVRVVAGMFPRSGSSCAP
jgi:hypothetical protein